jgi:hypothetical protein
MTFTVIQRDPREQILTLMISTILVLTHIKQQRQQKQLEKNLNFPPHKKKQNRISSQQAVINFLKF